MTLASSAAGTEAASAVETEVSAGTATETEVTTTPAEGAGTDAKSPAQSSGATDADRPKTMEEAIKAALQKPDADGASSNPEGKTDSAASEAAKEGEPAADKGAGEPTEADKEKDVPFHNHPRWKEVLQERDTARAEVEQFRGDAEEFRKITGFMEQSNLSPDETADGFVVMSLLKNDPVKALPRLEEIVGNLRRALGHELPDDLREKVENGYVDEETAKETARLRGQSQLTAARETERTQREKERADTEAARTAAVDFAKTASGWEADVKGRDPDYPKKAGAVLRYAKAIIADEGRPTTRQGVTEVLKRAYQAVNQDFGAILPARASTPKAPASGQSASSTSPKPQPKTLEDAIRIAATGR